MKQPIDYDQYSLDELIEINKALVRHIKELRNEKAHEIKKNLKVNDRVKINHIRADNKVYILTRIARKRAELKEEGTGRRVRAHITLLEKIDEGN